MLNKNSLAVKKCEAKQCYKRPKTLISSKAKKLIMFNFSALSFWSLITLLLLIGLALFLQPGCFYLGIYYT